MKSKRLLFCLLVILIGLLPVTVSAQRIFRVATVDYPGVGNATTPFGINNRGEIVGDYVDSLSVRRGFIRRLNGSFASIVEPDDTGHFTRARGINNRQTIAGDFLTFATNTYHGYFLRNGVFTQYDDAGPTFSTAVLGINDGGNFVGSFGNYANPNRSFVNIGGTATTINIPEAYDSQAVGINNKNIVVGSYRDSLLVDHGFIRSANGALTYPVNFPGSSSTDLNGINNRGWIVGSYTDSSGHQHGFFRKNSSTYVSFDYPNSTGTSLNGINDFGFIAGRYTVGAGAGVRHGFVAWVWAFPREEDDE